MNWLEYLTTASSWSGEDGITNRLLEHLQYSGTALLFTVLIALPLGLILGHLHKGSVIVLGLANLGRAVPAFGIVVIFAVSAWGVDLTTLTITLVLFALPQVLTNTYTGIAEVEVDIVEAARGIGMSNVQILRRIELPLAMPLIASGIRSAAVQIVGTATIAAYAGAGGLGQIVFRGYDSNLPALQVGGAVLVVVLALTAQGLLGLMQRAVTPTPLRQYGIIFRAPKNRKRVAVPIEMKEPVPTAR